MIWSRRQGAFTDEPPGSGLGSALRQCGQARPRDAALPAWAPTLGQMLMWEACTSLRSLAASILRSGRRGREGGRGPQRGRKLVAGHGAGHGWLGQRQAWNTRRAVLGHLEQPPACMHPWPRLRRLPLRCPPELTDTHSARHPPSLKCCLMRAAICRPLPTPAPSPAPQHLQRFAGVASPWKGHAQLSKQCTHKGSSSLPQPRVQTGLLQHAPATHPGRSRRAARSPAGWQTWRWRRPPSAAGRRRSGGAMGEEAEEGVRTGGGGRRGGLARVPPSPAPKALRPDAPLTQPLPPCTLPCRTTSCSRCAPPSTGGSGTEASVALSTRGSGCGLSPGFAACSSGQAYASYLPLSSSSPCGGW